MPQIRKGLVRGKENDKTLFRGKNNKRVGISKIEDGH